MRRTSPLALETSMLLQPGIRPVPHSTDYQLVRKLGAGAFGEVWHAHGPGGLDVALKFIPMSSEVRALELRSLEVMKSKRHPNLVSLFGAWHKDNCLILAMELCDCTLLDRLADALHRKLPGIPPDELLNYMRDAASGLDYLNAEQVQHRDVKPANLLLLGNGVKVADFGLAKVLEATVGSNTGAGTLAYTAPECFKGQLTQSSDQYSLAVTYYHLRTGRLLFKGHQGEIVYGHLVLDPDLTRLTSAEANVLARALAKEPGKRWLSCTAFVKALVSAGQGVSRKVPEHTQQEPARKKPESVAAILPAPLPLNRTTIEVLERRKQELLRLQGRHTEEQQDVRRKKVAEDKRQEFERPRSVPVAPNREQVKRDTIDPWLDNWSRALGIGAAVIVFLVAGYLLLDQKERYNPVLKKYEHSRVLNGWHLALLLTCYALAVVFTRGVAWIRKELAQQK